MKSSQFYKVFNSKTHQNNVNFYLIFIWLYSIQNTVFTWHFVHLSLNLHFTLCVVRIRYSRPSLDQGRVCGKPSPRVGNNSWISSIDFTQHTWPLLIHNCLLLCIYRDFGWPDSFIHAIDFTQHIWSLLIHNCSLLCINVEFRWANSCTSVNVIAALSQVNEMDVWIWLTTFQASTWKDLDFKVFNFIMH